jgi:hypothetical protein
VVGMEEEFEVAVIIVALDEEDTRARILKG